MPRRSLFAVLLLTAVAAAQTSLRIEPDSDVAPRVGVPMDLLVHVDPGPKGAKPGTLRLTVASDGATFKAPIPPPPDEADRYGAPFIVRVEMSVTTDEPFEVTASLDGRHADGTSFDLAKTQKIYPAPGGGGIPGFDVPDGTLVLKRAYLRDSPAKAGKVNAMVVELEITGEAYHVYGRDVEQGEVPGVPMIAELLPTGPEATFLSVGPYTPPGKELHGAFKLEIPMTPLREGVVETRLKLFWQACDPNLCLETQVTYPAVSWEAIAGDGTVEDPLAGVVSGGSGGSGSPRDQNLWLLFLGAIAAGLFALVMPCTYPLIPITISFFTKQGERREGKTTGLALAYGTGIVAIFAAIGAVVGLGVLTDENVLNFATNKWVNGVFALMFVYFGLSLIGLYEINLPSSLQNLAGRAGSGGGYMSVFAMGATLVITSFTCTAPFVGALLAYAVQSGEWVRVTATMAVFGLTMAIPFVFLSLSPKALSRLPKSGIWMKHLKVTLGIIELGLVFKFLSNVDFALGTRIIERETFIVLFGSSFLIAALYLADLPALFAKGRSWRLGKGTVVAIVVLLSITAFFFSGLDGKPLPVSQLEAFLPAWEAQYDKNFLAVIKEDYEKGIAKAMELGAPVFLHFTGFQ